LNLRKIVGNKTYPDMFDIFEPILIYSKPSVSYFHGLLFVSVFLPYKARIFRRNLMAMDRCWPKNRSRQG